MSNDYSLLGPKISDVFLWWPDIGLLWYDRDTGKVYLNNEVVNKGRPKRLTHRELCAAGNPKCKKKKCNICNETEKIMRGRISWPDKDQVLIHKDCIDLYGMDDKKYQYLRKKCLDDVYKYMKCDPVDRNLEKTDNKGHYKLVGPEFEPLPGYDIEIENAE